MAKWLPLLFALCVLPALVTAHSVVKPFHIHGKVYCDTCRCGFETKKTTYIPGATVRIECVDRTTLHLKYSIQNYTDWRGSYNILVEGDHADDICSVVLVSSPLAYCKTPDPGRSRSEIILTRSNGAISDHHFANAMGFRRDEELPGCTELVSKLLYSE